MSLPTEESPEMIRRRELLRRAAWLLGGAISAPAALAILQGCSARDSGEVTATALQTLDAAQLALVAEIAEIMIPKTETAGAKDAGVPLFIDGTLAAVYPQEDQQRFKSGLGEFEAGASKSGKRFLEREPAERVELVKQSLVAALGAERDDQKPFILMVRELTLLGYFTSKVGIADNMDYVAVPTAFHGCVPLSQMKKHVYWE